MASTFYVVGSINMDLVANTERFPLPGETVRGSNFFTSPGGKGANQAVALARLGAHVHMVGKVGDDTFADQYMEYFTREGIDTSYIEQAESVSTGIAVIEVDPSGENHIVLVPGANDKVDKPYVDHISSRFDSNSIVLLQLEVPYQTVLHTLRKAKEAGACTILDPAPAAMLSEELYKYVDYLTPNSTEISVLAGIATDTESGLNKAVERILYLGVSTIVLKKGPDGASIFFPEDERRIKKVKEVQGFPVEAVDTTAAGDSFNAGFAYGLGNGYSIEEAVRFANSVGALSTLEMGAQTAMPSKKKVDSFLNSQRQ